MAFMSHRLLIMTAIGLFALGSAFALFQYLAPQSDGIIASVFRGGDIIDTWHTSSAVGAQTVDMGFTEQATQPSYSDQIVDGYRYQPAFQLQNCTLSKENVLFCNGSAYEYDAKVLSDLTEVVAKQTFNIQFIAARYIEDKPLPLSSRDKTQTIQSGKVFFVTDQKYIGGLRIEPNTVIVVTDRKLAIPFFRNTVESSYRDLSIKITDITNDFSPIEQIVQQNYADQKTKLSVSDLSIIQGGNSVDFEEDIQSIAQIGTDNIQFALQGFSSLSPSALANLKASFVGDSLSPTRSGSTLLLTTNKSIKQDTRLPLIVSYTYGGVSQTLRFQYRTLPVFSAFYKQEQDYSTSKLSNRTTLTFSQAVSGTVLDAALKLTKVPYQLDYRDKNTSSTVYDVTRYTDPTKTTSIDLSALRSLYGDTLTKSFILKIEPYSLAEYQRYASVVGSPIALVPQSSEYAYKAQVVAKNINNYDLWLRSCTVIQDPSLILKKLHIKPKKDYGEQLLSSLLDCNASKKTSIANKPFVRWKEYPTTFSFAKLLGGTEAHPIVEVGVKDFNQAPGTIVMTTDIGVYAHYSLKDNTLYAWMHSLKTSQGKKNLSYTVYGIDKNNNPLTLSGRLESNMLKLSLPKSISVGYLYLYEPRKTKSTVEVYDEFLGTTGTQTIETEVAGDQTLVALSPSYVQTDNVQRMNSFVTNEGGLSPREWALYAYTDRVLYKPGEQIHVAGWLRRVDGSFTKAPQGSVRVSVRNAQGKEIITKDMKLTDRFGGFGVDFTLPDTADLGFYGLVFSYNGVEYYHTIQVKEFTKPMIYVTHEIETKDDATMIRLQPRYYFGADLSSYNWSSDYSLTPAASLDDRSRCNKDRCDQPITFAYQENYNSSGGKVQRSNYAYPSIQLRLGQTVTRPQQLMMTTTLTDTQTQETVYDVVSEQLFPRAIVGIKGRSYSWTSADKPYQLEGEVRSYKTSATAGSRESNYEPLNKGNLKLSIYKLEQSSDELPGVDGEYYYENNNKYKLIASDTLSVSDSKFSTTLKQLTSNGQYKIELAYDDIYIAQQYVTVYGGGIDENARYGSLDNSNELALSIAPKEYNPGDTLTIGLDPYIKGARVLVLVEKDGKLLYQSEQNLDNPTLNLTVQDTWFPNVHITVMQLVGQDVGKTISKKRAAEPRFFVGTQQVALSKRSRELDVKIAISTASGSTPEYYTPGQEVKLSFDVQDRQQKARLSRLSVAVIDKSLTDLYDEMKSPLERFYAWIEQGFRVITNYHFLFKALKVSSGDGQKGGGAGGDGSVLNPRKVFLNTAYRNPSVLTDKNGRATVSFKLPDNLTTWMVDVVAVGEAGQMGTQRAYFTSSQKYILTALMPQFVDPMTKIRIPVTLISRASTGLSQSDLRTQIKIYATIADQRIPLTIAGDDNRSYVNLDMTTVPMQYLLNTPTMKITLGVEQDAIEYEVPIRLESARRVSFVTAEGKQGSLTHTISGLPGAQQMIRVSTLPSIDRDNQFHFMFRYPYGGAEQSTSLIDSILLSTRLAQQGLLSTGTVKFDANTWMVFTHKGRQQDTEVIRTALTQLVKYQRSDGLFAYRDEGKTDINLSLYVLSVLDSLNTDTYPLAKPLLTALRKGLEGKGDQTQQLYYQMILSRKGKIITKTVDELANKKVSYQTDVLAFVAKAYQGSFDTVLRTRLSKIYEENPTLVSNGSIYTNTIPLQSMLIQALLHLDKDTEALKLTRDLTKRMDGHGGRGWSTQDTRRGLRAVADRYLTNKIDPKQSSVPVTLKINNKNIPLTLLSGQADYDYLATDTDKKLNISWSSELPLFVTSSHTWIERSADASPQTQNIRYLAYTETGVTTVLSDSVGTMNQHSFRFQTKTDAAQVAVVATIPAYLRIMQGFGADAMQFGYDERNPNPQTANFLTFQSANDAGVWYDCTPTHYEQRYDRLVLFYNKLPAGARCDISFMTSKTHDAAAQPALLTVYEMYDTSTFGETMYK